MVDDGSVRKEGELEILGQMLLLTSEGGAEKCDNSRPHWYPVMVELHGFIVTVSRIVVNHDGARWYRP